MALRVPARLRRRFTLYTDDTGQPSIRPPSDPLARHVFAYGGIVVPNDGVGKMARRWYELKAYVFGTRNEVKAGDFVRDDSPLPKISEAVDRRDLAQGMLAVIMNSLSLRPLGVFVDKSNTPDHFIIKGEDGKPASRSWGRKGSRRSTNGSRSRLANQRTTTWRDVDHPRSRWPTASSTATKPDHKRKTAPSKQLEAVFKVEAPGVEF